MKLYTYFRSSAAYRVRIALNLKGMPYEHDFDPSDQGRRPAALAGIPRDQSADARAVARLLDSGEVLIQSLGDHRISRRDPSGAARCCRPTRSSAPRCAPSPQLIACDIHPLNNLAAAAISQARAEARAAGDRRLVSPLGHRGLHRARDDDPARPYCFGAQRHARRYLPGAADVQRAPAQGSARRFPEDRRRRRRAA